MVQYHPPCRLPQADPRLWMRLYSSGFAAVVVAADVDVFVAAAVVVVVVVAATASSLSTTSWNLSPPLRVR